MPDLTGLSRTAAERWIREERSPDLLLPTGLI